MKATAIGELTEAVKTWNPSREPDTEFDYIDLSAVDNSSKTVTSAKPTVGSEAPSRARQLVAAGDILVSTVRPNLNAVAVVPPHLDGATASTGFTVLRPASQLDGRYLFHWVRSPDFISDMVRRATGASYPAVSDRIVKNSQILAPPLPEQRRIAAILDQADALRAKRHKVLARLDALNQAIFVSLFGDGFSVSSGTRTVGLGEVVERITYGFTNPMSHVPTGIPIVTAKSIRNQTIDLVGGAFTTRDEFEALTDKSRPREGDVLVTKDGTIGRCAVVDVNVPFCINQSVALLRPSHDLRPRYLVGYLTLEQVQRKMRGMGKGNALKHLQITELASFPIPVPSIARQLEFEERIAQGNARQADSQRALAADHELFASIQHRAFRGDL